MSKKRIKIGVAGLGRIGWGFHCSKIAESCDFELIAVADPETSRRKEAEVLYGCRAYARYDTMLKKEEDLDAVVIATPTHFHKTHALTALRHDLHVFLEKPMAMDFTESQIITRAAKRARRVLTVYQPHRAAAWFQHLCRIVRSGRIGTPYYVRGGRYGYTRRNDWQSLARYGGGMLNNYGAHVIDLVLQLTGSRVKKVFCNLRRVASLGDAEDVVKILYETPDRMLGEVDINQACALPSREFEVHGTRGAVLKLSRQELLVKYLNPVALDEKKLDARLASTDRKYPLDNIPFRERIIKVGSRYQVDVYKDLARAIRAGSPPFVTPEDALAVMKMVEKCRKDSQGTSVTPI